MSERNEVFINKILKLTKDLDRTYNMEHEAKLAGELFKRIITECYREIGYPIWGTDYKITAIDGGYKIKFTADLDTSG